MNRDTWPADLTIALAKAEGWVPEKHPLQNVPVEERDKLMYKELDPRLKVSVPVTEDEPVFDIIQRPAHYNQGRIEVIDAIEDWNLGYHLSNVIKYVARSPYKGSELQDLEKAKWYLERYINKLLENRK